MIVQDLLKDDRSYLTEEIRFPGQPNITYDDWRHEVFYFPLEPKKPISEFDASSGFFLSKKIPLRIVAKLSEDKIL